MTDRDPGAGGDSPTARSRPTTSPARRTAFSLVAALGVVALLAAALEIGLRVSFGRVEQITGAVEWQDDEFGGFTYHWDAYHPILGWSNLPGYTSDESVPFEVTINAQGLRARREYSSRPAPGITRIALFGDSLAFGEEVDDDETIAAQLEAVADGVEVLNYGVHGYGFGQSVLRLEHEGGLLAPDHYVVLVLFPEDLVRDRLSHFLHAKPLFRLDDGGLRIENVPVPEASRIPWVMRHSFAAAWLLGRRGAWHRSVVGPGPDIELGHAVARRAASICDERDQPLTLVVMLAPGGIQRWLADPRWRRRHDDRRARFVQMDIETLDLVPAQIAAYLDEGPALFAPLSHWSERGNRLWAEHIAHEIGLR